MLCKNVQLASKIYYDDEISWFVLKLVKFSRGMLRRTFTLLFFKKKEIYRNKYKIKRNLLKYSNLSKQKTQSLLNSLYCAEACNKLAGPLRVISKAALFEENAVLMVVSR